MRIDKIESRPVQESINPELEFDVEIFIQEKYEVPIEITGHLFSDENKKLANIYECMYEPNRTIGLSARDGSDVRGGKLVIKMIAPLNHKVLDYIETLRTKNPKSDVILNLDIFIKTLVSKTNLSNMFLMKLEELSSKLPENYRNAETVFYQYRSRFSTSTNNMWILSGDGSPTFIQIESRKFNNKVVISSSDWIHDYCPVFQIGRFSVFEYLMPDYTEGAGDVEERLNESINALGKMEENMIKGEWNQVIEDSRAVWELLRNQADIKDLLMKDGYTEQAFEDLNESFKQLFNYSSKFHHREDREKNIMPEIKASKEDAHLIFATSMAIVNLISKKMQRLSFKQ